MAMLHRMFDFCIIGGGIAGVSAAARLAPHGSVVILEREAHVAYHASGRSAALFEENYSKPAVTALARASREYFETAHGGVLSPRGFMMLCKDGDQDAFAHDKTTMGMQGLTMAEAAAMVPILDTSVVTQAAISPNARDIDTDLMMQNFLKDARAGGAVLHCGHGVSRLHKTGGHWAVGTDAGGEFTARHIINAAGAWVDEIAKLAGIPPLGVTPLRRSVARIAAPGGHDTRHWPMLFGPGETWWAKPDAGAFIVSLAEETPSAPMDAWPHDMDLAEGLERYQDYVTEPVTRPIASWAGLRTFAPDRCLVLGPSPHDPSFVWSAGQGGYGFLTAPAASQLVADLVTGATPSLAAPDVQALHPNRFA